MLMMEYEECYSAKQTQAIDEEFSRLKQNGIYLDHAGGTLYSQCQIDAMAHELTHHVYGNPHSLNIPSVRMHDTIEQIRTRILTHFHTNESQYSVIFTSGATAALKLVAESFGQSSNNVLLYSQDNHTSVLGMREYFSRTISLTPNELQQMFDNDDKSRATLTINDENDDLDESNDLLTGLFVYPLESNFSGRKYPKNWSEKIHSVTQVLGNAKMPKKITWYTLWDAAAFVATNSLDLSQLPVDFVTISFYKLFGYPTGLGALLVRNSIAHTLRKRYFGGGTVQIALSQRKFHVLKPDLTRFEDGSVSYLSICALRHGFDTFARLNLCMDLINCHVFALTQYVAVSLDALRHANGRKCVEMYGLDAKRMDCDTHGGILAFLPLRANGDFVGYAEVLQLANAYKIHLRTGCFCNPGACQMHLRLTNDMLVKQFESGHVCGDKVDLIDGVPTGVVRISFGYMSTKREADAFLSFFRNCFVSVHEIPKKISAIDYTHNNATKLTRVFIYPIKSCAAFEIPATVEWPLEPTGLRYDRTWMIVNAHGACVTQKMLPEMCLIRPELDMQANQLVLRYKNELNITISLNFDHFSVADNNNATKTLSSNVCRTTRSKVCRDAVDGIDCGQDVATWLSHVLNTDHLRLFYKPTEFVRTFRNKQKSLSASDSSALSLTNEAQFLLINQTSVDWLVTRIHGDVTVSEADRVSYVLRFRPNFVVETREPFAENKWVSFAVNGIQFKREKLCTRCQMICVDPLTGEQTIEPYRTISQYFDGKVQFGVYLSALVTGLVNCRLKPGEIVSLEQDEE